MMHQRGSQSPVKADQGDQGAQFIEGPSAQTPKIDCVNGHALARDVFQTGLSRHGDVDVEAGLPQRTGESHSVLQEVVDLVINEEEPWCAGFNRRHGVEKGCRRPSGVLAVLPFAVALTSR